MEFLFSIILSMSKTKKMTLNLNSGHFGLISDLESVTKSINVLGSLNEQILKKIISFPLVEKFPCLVNENHPSI